jgi:hypothetical protein
LRQNDRANKQLGRKDDQRGREALAFAKFKPLGRKFRGCTGRAFAGHAVLRLGAGDEREQRMSVQGKIEPGRGGDGTRVLMSGLVVTAEGRLNVTIRDVSRTGAHVVSRDELPNGSDVLLKRGPLVAAAHVAGVSGKEATLSFYRELSPDEIERALPAAVLRGD